MVIFTCYRLSLRQDPSQSKASSFARSRILALLLHSLPPPGFSWAQSCHHQQEAKWPIPHLEKSTPTRNSHLGDPVPTDQESTSPIFCAGSLTPTRCLRIISVTQKSSQRLLRRWDHILGSIASYLRWDTGEARAASSVSFLFLSLSPPQTSSNPRRTGEKGRERALW